MTGRRRHLAAVPAAPDGAVPDGAVPVPDEAVVAALALDAALDLAPGPHPAGDDDLLRVASAVRASAPRHGAARPALAFACPGPARPARRRGGRRRAATVATLAASVATIAVGADLALPSGVGPAGHVAAGALRLARSHGAVVLAPAGGAAGDGARVAGITCPGRAHCLAWAGSDGHAVLAASRDAGARWTHRPPPGGATVVADVQCGTPERCWLVGGSGTGAVVEVSVDGGRTWTAGSLPGGIAELRSISCAGVAICWAVGTTAGGGPVVVTTADGGTQWTAQSLPAGLTGLQSVACPTATSCWAGGTATSTGAGSTTAAVVATADGGTRWHRVALPVTAAGGGPSAVTSVTCASPRSCWAVEASHGTAAVLTAAGGTWQEAGATGTRGGAVYAAGTTCTASCAPPSGSAAARALAAVEGGTAGDLTGRTGAGALACATAVECWVVIATGSASAARALPGPARTL